jgi:hypothetical protein
VAVAYLLGASRFLEDYRSAEAEVSAVTHVVVVGQRGESLAVAEALLGDFHVAAAVQQGEPAVEERYVTVPPLDDTAEEVLVWSQADGPVAEVSSAEFPADENTVFAVAVQSPDLAARAEPETVPEGDCSQAACRDIAGAAAQVADWQTADAEPTDPADRYPQERCEFLEEQAYYQGHRAEERCYSVDHLGCY